MKRRQAPRKRATIIMCAAPAPRPITITAMTMATATVTITTVISIFTSMARTAPHREAMEFAYLRDPEAIYRRSFALLRREVDLGRLPRDLRPLALRLVHTSGEPSLIDDLVASPGAGTIGRKALAHGADILVDASMVAAGITKRHAL